VGLARELDLIKVENAVRIAVSSLSEKGWKEKYVICRLGGHSFSLYGPTLSRQITYLFFPSSQTKKNSRKKLTQALL